MHHVIAWPIVVVTAILLAGCVDPVGPIPRGVADPTSVAAIDRRRPPATYPFPDSVSVPPLLPPIYEEIPTILDVLQ